MFNEPATKYSIAFFDGQNLYQHAKAAFGHNHPNYDPLKLHAAVCAEKGWIPNLTRFYTGVPDHREAEMWAGYWSSRVLAMKRAGIVVTTRPLRYRKDKVLINGVDAIHTTPQEKGIDVRLALDIVSSARKKEYDVAIIFSQDQDLCEIVQEIREISREQGRWIKIVSAFPSGPQATSPRGIDKTEWHKIDESVYNVCIDQHDYRPAKFR